MVYKTNTEKGVSKHAHSQLLCIEFILDETGSMNSCKKEAIAGFNNFIKSQKELDSECLVTLTKFEGGNMYTPYQDLDINLVPQMNENTFIPSGCTNLYDAVVTRINSGFRFDSWAIRPEILYIVMTDGMDNMSSNTYSTVRDYIKNSSSNKNFVYLGAHANAEKIATMMGFSDGNIKSFEKERMEDTMEILSNATTVYRTSHTTNFFEAK